MNVSDQILEEIRERWKDSMGFVGPYTVPAKDIYYLLNRLDAAEKAARGTWKRCEMLAAEIRKMKGEES